MLSKRDKLLIRPWQQRKYENHRRKVQSALPAIDTQPPPLRQHVDLKLKKQQKENERCDRIEKENMILLRRLNYIMRTNRVDNYWVTPQPNFLNRVAVNDVQQKLSRSQSLESSCEEIVKSTNRKSKCIACTPQKVKKVTIPEERIPWEPEKLPVSTRIRSKSVPVRKTSLPVIVERDTSSSATPDRKPFMLPVNKVQLKNVDSKHFIKKQRKQTNFNKELIKPPQSIVISRGALKLAVNFPSDTSITFLNGNSEKLLMRSCCNCKNGAAASTVC